MSKFRGFSSFIKYSDLIKKNERTKKSIVEDNKLVIGIFIKVYELKDSKDQIIKELDWMIDDSDYEVIGNDYWEWEIEKWSSLENSEFSPEMLIGGYNWKIKLYPNGDTYKNYICIYLSSDEFKEIKSSNTAHICVNNYFYIRNYYDYKCYYLKGENTTVSYSKNCPNWGWQKFIEKDKLFVKNNRTLKSLIQNDKVVIGAYIHAYKFTLDHYKNELYDIIHYIDDESYNVNKKDIFEWSIKNWNNFKNKELSPTFDAGNCDWKISICKNEDNNELKDYISLYLKNMNIENNSSSKVLATFVLCIRNTNDYSYFFTREYTTLKSFTKNNNEIGFKKFIKKSDLKIKYNDTDKPLIEDDSFTISAYIRVYNFEKI
eukprot:jgi/Orpsp1_1/1184191/evm.model.c7180000088403.1